MPVLQDIEETRRRRRECMRRYRASLTDDQKDVIREKDRKRKRKTYKENPEKILGPINRWKERNPEKARRAVQRWHKANRLNTNLRVRLWKALKGGSKRGSAVRDLGCSIPELKTYLEGLFKPGMSWDNYGEWHIDHKTPLSAVDLTKREELLKVCHFTNLQPLWAVDNLKKHTKIVDDIWPHRYT